MKQEHILLRKKGKGKNMLGHWFIIANQKNVRVFTEIPEDSDKRVAEKTNLKLLKSFDNPLGQERRKNLIRKQAGRGVKSIGRTACIRYTEVKRHDPFEEASAQFAKEIATFLESEKRLKKFDSLTIVAEPHFLGKIKMSMKPSLKKVVTSWIGKNLQKIPQHDLPNFLITQGAA